MTTEEQICNLWDKVKSAEADVIRKNEDWSALKVATKIAEPFPKRILITVSGEYRGIARCYAVEISEQYGDVLFRRKTRNTGLGGFESVCSEMFSSLAAATIWSKNPKKIPNRKSRAKYRKGGVIRSLDELAAQSLVYWGDKITPKSWFMNWNFGMAKKALEIGFIRYAVKKEDSV